MYRVDSEFGVWGGKTYVVVRCSSLERIGRDDFVVLHVLMETGAVVEWNDSPWETYPDELIRAAP